MDWHHPIPGLPDEVTARVAGRAVGYEPDSAALLVRGSYATGKADEGSDLDLTVITWDAPLVPYRCWFERLGERMLLVSVSAKPMSDWLAKRQEAAEWSLGFPACDVAGYLWHTDDARAALGDDPSALRPAGPAYVEELVNNAVKVRRAQRAADGLKVRFHAQYAAHVAPALLRDLNPERVVTDTTEAIAAALELEIAPPNFRADFEVCAGLRPAGVDETAAAAARLARELVVFLREHAPDVDPMPDVPRLLRDGEFERYLES